jgi:hypothetical protein
VHTAVNGASPGDEIRLKAGTYNITTEILVDVQNTTAQNRITIKPDSANLSAIIDGTNLPNGVNCFYVSRPYVTIEGLEVRNCVQNGIQIDGDIRGDSIDTSRNASNWHGDGTRNYYNDGADGVIIRNNYVHNISYDGLKINHLNNALIEGNEVYKTGLCNITGGSSCTQQGIDMVGVYNSTIRSNKVHDDPNAYHMHTGIFFKGGSENITVENNEIYNIGTSDSIGIEVGGDTENYNHRYTASNFPNPFASGLSINSFILSNYDMWSNASYYVPYEQYVAEARNAIVRGNIIHDVSRAMSYRNVYGAKVYNNTFYNAGIQNNIFDPGSGTSLPGYWHVMWDDQNASHRTYGVKVYNNLHYNSSNTLNGAAYWDRGNARGNLPCSVGFAADYNVLYNGGSTFTLERDFPSPITVDTHSVTSVPLIGANYRLQEGSPAIGKGVNLRSIGILGASETWTDRDGIVRSTQTDIGALLYVP